jgi:hypothetical protein
LFERREKAQQLCPTESKLFLAFNEVLRKIKKLSRQKSLPEATLTMQAALSIEQSFRRFRRFAWTSAFLSLLTGLSHVRTFPSYNIVLAVVALYGSGLQGDRQAALKSISVCAIIGAISIVADVLFCSFWAGEVSRLL